MFGFFFVFINLFILFIYFWLCWVFVAAHGLSLVVVSSSSLGCAGFSLRWLLLLRSTGSRRVGFSSCGMQAQQLWRTGLVAPRHVGSSRTRAATCVPCLGRRILNHCTTRKVPSTCFYKQCTLRNLLNKKGRTYPGQFISQCQEINTGIDSASLPFVSPRANQCRKIGKNYGMK